jgi:hypothetical protein
LKQDVDVLRMAYKYYGKKVESCLDKEFVSRNRFLLLELELAFAKTIFTRFIDTTHCNVIIKTYS